jgi:hypothetical protein
MGVGLGLAVTNKDARVGRAVHQEVCFARQCHFCAVRFG